MFHTPAGRRGSGQRRGGQLDRPGSR